MNIFYVRPGITGLAQIAGIDMSNPSRLAKVDATYIQTQTFALDIRLIIMTALGKGGGDKTSDKLL